MRIGQTQAATKAGKKTGGLAVDDEPTQPLAYQLSTNIRARTYVGSVTYATANGPGAPVARFDTD